MAGDATMTTYPDPVCLGLSVLSEPDEQLDGKNTPTIQRVVCTLDKALKPSHEHVSALNALARHIFDASTHTSSNFDSLSCFGRRIETAFTQRLNSLRDSTRRTVEIDLSNCSKARITAQVRSEADKSRAKEICRALTEVRTANDIIRSLLKYAPMPQHPNNLASIPPPALRTDIRAQAKKAAEEKKAFQLLKELVDDPSLDPKNLPRIVKNRLAAHYSITRRLTLARVARSELKNELLTLRALAIHATTRTTAILGISQQQTESPSTSQPSPLLSDSAPLRPDFPTHLARTEIEPCPQQLPLVMLHTGGYELSNSPFRQGVQVDPVIERENQQVDESLLGGETIKQENDLLPPLFSFQDSLKHNGEYNATWTNDDEHSPIKPMEMAAYCGRAPPAA